MKQLKNLLNTNLNFKNSKLKGGKKMNEETGISIKKSSLWKFGTFLFFGLFIISLFTGGFGGFVNGSNSVNGNVVAVPSNPSPGQPSIPSQHLK